MRLTIVAGARPNFMKIAPIIGAILKKKVEGFDISFRLVHTGQHYDEKMSNTFFTQLNIPHPDINLECGGGSQAEQTAAIMVAFEVDLIQNPTDLVVVVGDVTSTMACSIVAKKQGVKVAHVEAGIRSYDMTMPEEINRMVTDAISDYFFTTSVVASQNLLNSGISDERIFFVGNVMIDTLLQNKERFIQPSFFESLGLQKGNYLVLTLHRPANVDEGEKLTLLMEKIIENSRGLPIVFPIHPRTAKIIRDLNIRATNLCIVDPMGYLEFNYLVQHAKAVITDSGGITEETTVMGIPCMTLRNNTERPETVAVGTNELLGTNPDNICPAFTKLFEGNWKRGDIPELWDGRASERIVDIVTSLHTGNAGSR